MHESQEAAQLNEEVGFSKEDEASDAFAQKKAPGSAYGVVPVLRISERTIRQVAWQRVPWGLAEILVRQAWTEARFKVLQHTSIRSRENAHAVQAYGRMNSREFEWINARQRWANWRNIPRNLDGRVPNRPLLAIDLCCGVGHSTEVLACYLPRDSRILGLEYQDSFVETALSRQYPDIHGRPAQVGFRAQSVLETFRTADGQPVPTGSVDVVNSSGAIGCHFDESATTQLAREVARVVRSGGIAMLDSGKAGTNRRALERIFSAVGFEVLGTAKSCFADPYTHVCLRRR